MSLKDIPAGLKIPEDIYVIIEIPFNFNPIKYEVDKRSGIIFVDRFLSTPMFYPCNYGYINHTLSLDGDPIDVLIPTMCPVEPGSVVRARPVGALKTIDESGKDIKIIAVPHSKLTSEYNDIKDINNFSNLFRLQIEHFFMHYKDLEEGKWTKIQGWENANFAKNEIIIAFERILKK